jgi:rRNA pseudouridine-1189 N-methylase Emg1 (Nep1/Mra1 family)
MMLRPERVAFNTFMTTLFKQKAIAPDGASSLLKRQNPFQTHLPRMGQYLSEPGRIKKNQNIIVRIQGYIVHTK